MFDFSKQPRNENIYWCIYRLYVVSSSARTMYIIHLLILRFFPVFRFSFIFVILISVRIHNFHNSIGLIILLLVYTIISLIYFFFTRFHRVSHCKLTHSFTLPHTEARVNQSEHWIQTTKRKSTRRRAVCAEVFATYIWVYGFTVCSMRAGNIARHSICVVKFFVLCMHSTIFNNLIFVPFGLILNKKETFFLHIFFRARCFHYLARRIEDYICNEYK